MGKVPIVDGADFTSETAVIDKEGHIGDANLVAMNPPIDLSDEASHRVITGDPVGSCLDTSEARSGPAVVANDVASFVERQIIRILAEWAQHGARRRERQNSRRRKRRHKEICVTISERYAMPSMRCHGQFCP